MNSIPFRKITANPEVDVHPSPDPFHSRIAVCGLWTLSKALRKRFPDVAVVAPLRTVQGLDELYRHLLANPQIEVLIVTGPDLSENKEVTSLLRRAFVKKDSSVQSILGSDLREEVFPRDPFRFVRMIEVPRSGTFELIPFFGSPEDRCVTSGTESHLLSLMDTVPPILRPPPIPLPTRLAGPGAPSERILALDLEDAWRQGLSLITRYGTTASSQHGETKELQNLTVVLTDPTLRYEEEKKEEFLKGFGPFKMSRSLVSELKEEYLGSSEIKDGREYTYGSRMAKGTQEDDFERPMNQVYRVFELLKEDKETRAGWLTPWIPEVDSGILSGRPCLTGLLFRGTRNTEGASHSHALNLTIFFRSHEFFLAWPYNLAGLIAWQMEWAEKLSMSVGSCTCISSSAHIYHHKYDMAQIEAEKLKDPAIRYDPRSSFRVEWASDLCDRCSGDGIDCTCEKGQTNFRLRAVALSPGEKEGTEVLAVYEAPTSGSLRLEVARSRLVTTVEAALWLGSEIERVAALRKNPSES